MAERLEEEMVATYGVTIAGISRTKAEMAKLDNVIRSLRAGDYGGGTSATQASLGGPGRGDVFVSAIDLLEGRVQTAAQNAMIKGMDLGKSVQGTVLRAATTKTGSSGQSHVGGRNGPGRDDSGGLIKAIKRNVEVLKTSDLTIITGYHGWKDEEGTYYEFQENGTKGRGGGLAPEQRSQGKVFRAPNKKKKYASGQAQRGGSGVPAANSLGAAIIPVREFLKAEIKGLKK